MIVIKYITFAWGNCGFHVNYVVRPLQLPGVMEALSSGGVACQYSIGSVGVLLFHVSGPVLMLFFLPGTPFSLPCFLTCKFLLQDSTQILFHLGVLWQPPDPAH